MLRLCKCAVGFLFAASVLLTPSVASADIIRFNGEGRAAVVTVGGTVASNYHGAAWAGELLWQWVGTAPAGFAQSFYSYCVDLANFVQPYQTVTPVSSDGFTNGVTNGGTKAAWLFNEYAADIHSMTPSTTASNSAAALQLAIWEAMYDTTANLTSGGFNANGTNSSILSQANVYLTALYAAQPWDAVATILSTNGGQDQIVAQVSEPSTLLMVGMAFFAVAALARRPARQS